MLLPLLLGQGAPYSPSVLFALAEPGFWSLVTATRLWKDIARTDPVTADDDLVASWALSVAGGGFIYAEQANATFRPKYKIISGKEKLLFNGSFMTVSFDMSSVNVLTTIMGIRKLGGETFSFPFEYGTDSDSVNGSFALLGRPEGFRSISRGTTTVAAADDTIAVVPFDSVMTMQASIAAPSVQQRRNKSNLTSSTSSQGTGNYGNRTLHIGARAGGSFPCNMEVSCLIVRGATTSGTDLTNAEDWAANPVEGSNGVAPSAGTAAGTSTGSAVGASTRSASGASAGLATVSATGRAVIGAAGTSAGTATASAVGDIAGSISNGAGSAAGSATVAAVGASTATSAGTSAGVAAAQATGRATAQATGSAAGVGAASGTGAAVAAATGSASGVAAATAESPGGSINSGAGSAAGSATVAAIGSSIRAASGTAAGAATASGAGASISAASGAASGSAVVICFATARAAAAGAAAGAAAVSGQGSSTAQAQGAAAGLSTTQAVGQAVIPDAFQPQFTVQGFWLTATVRGSFGPVTVKGQWPAYQIDGNWRVA